MKILLLSKDDVLSIILEKQLVETINGIKEELVERKLKNTIDEKVVVAPSRAEMFEICGYDEAAQKKYDGIDLDQKLSCLVSFNQERAGVKIVGANVLNKEKGFLRSESVITLYESDTFRPICILNGTEISALRTAAYTSIVGEYLLPKKTDNIIACIGTGKIVETALLCLDKTLSDRISKIMIHSISADRDEFVERMNKEIGIELQSASSTEEAVRDADYVITATTALDPLVDDSILKPSATVLLLGADEVGRDFLYRSYNDGLIVCDDWELVKHRNCQSLPFLFNDDKSLDESKIIELWEVIRGEIKPSDYQCIHVNCVGIPALDIRLATQVYKFAREKGMGIEIEL